MTAFYVAQVKIKDELKLQDYSSKAMSIFISFGGELVAKGTLQTNNQDIKSHDFSVVMQFPNLDMLNEALNSDSYQAIVPIRLAAANVTISVYQ
jgi:uncharacterized protein (DUF1330 family)